MIPRVKQEAVSELNGYHAILCMLLGIHLMYDNDT